MKAYRLSKIALFGVFGLILALPQSARSQMLVAGAEEMVEDTESVRLMGDAVEYDALRRVGDWLYARGEIGRALQLREELGDMALSNGDSGVAAHAYIDAAWIAGELAQRAESRSQAKRAVWLNLDGDVTRLEAEAVRLLKKAESLKGDTSDQESARIDLRLGSTQ